jgi:hypothetical protein
MAARIKPAPTPRRGGARTTAPQASPYIDFQYR